MLHEVCSPVLRALFVAGVATVGALAALPAGSAGPGGATAAPPASAGGAPTTPAAPASPAIVPASPAPAPSGAPSSPTPLSAPPLFPGAQPATGLSPTLPPPMTNIAPLKPQSPSPAPIPSSTSEGVAKAFVGAVVARPSSVDFGELWSGDVRQQKVSVSVGRNGNVSAMLAPATPFRIVKMDVFGYPPSSPSKMLKPSTPKAPTIDPGKGGGPSQGGGFVPKSAPPMDQSGGAQVSAVNKVLLASTSAAPFTLAASQGDDVFVTLEFKPDPNIFSGTHVGDHKASLAVTGIGWRADVPVLASYSGVRVGVVAVLDPKEVDVVIPESYYPDKPYPLTINVSLVNVEKQARQVSIAPSNLPSWLKFPGQTVNVPAGQTMKVALAFQVEGYNKVPRGKPIWNTSAELSIQYGNTTKKLPFSIRSIPGRAQWGFSDGSGWWATLTIRPDGNTTFVFACPKGLGPNKCLAAYYVGNLELYKLAVINAPTNSVTVPRQYVAEHYVELLSATPVVKAPAWNPDDSNPTPGKPE